MLAKTEQETLYQSSISTRSLPFNFEESDLELFQNELKKVIPPTVMLHLKDVTINSDSTLSQGRKILLESFPAPKFGEDWTVPRITAIIKNFFLRPYRRIDQDAYWITDIWSGGYFHWMTDALPRLFAVRNKIQNSTLLLPGEYARNDYVLSSLKSFPINDVKFIYVTSYCTNLKVPTHTAPTGNYNEEIIKGLRSLLTNAYQTIHNNGINKRIYISRRKAQKRKIANEEECIQILKQYDFEIVLFEDQSFEQQLNIALNAQYLISNHGAGLTNILFMKPGTSILELRQKEDSHNNCYFSLASALDLKYFYQLCDSVNPKENAHVADIIVNCRKLSKSIEQMLAGTFR